jgi:hypothetical protein
LFGLQKTKSVFTEQSFFLIFLTYNQWVSLKILLAEFLQDSQEITHLQLLERHSQGQSSKYIVQLLDSFIHQGPNGQHQCLVFELLGPTVNRVLDWCDLDAEVVVRISI